MSFVRRIAVLLILLALTACSSETKVDTTVDTIPDGSPDEMIVQLASYDVAVGDAQRVIVGLLTGDHRDIAFGTPRMRFQYVSDGKNPQDAEPEAWQDASFLMLPEEQPKGSIDKTTLVTPGEGRGVFAVTRGFDKAGYWQVQVEADVDGFGKKSSSAAVQVHDKPRFPAVGEAAMKSKNLTVDSDISHRSIDSRAQPDGPIPDPQLHDSTIAADIEAGKPVLVSFATPVFCRSRFCGPTIDLVRQVEADYSGAGLDVIHVEVWKDFDAQVPNDVAKDWLFRAENLPEPWTFLIGADGKIKARWDNIVTREEIDSALRESGIRA